MNNKALSIFISLTFVVTLYISLTSYAETNMESLQETPIGTVYLKFGHGKEMKEIKAENIAADGRYDMLWNVKDNTDFINAECIDFYIERINDSVLGEYGKIKLEINEIWLDGVKYDGKLAREPVYTFLTDDIVRNGVYNIDAQLKNNNTPDFTVEDTVRVVFTITGTSDIFVRTGSILGDVNEDHQVNAVDSSLVLSHYANMSTNGVGLFSKEQCKVADFNSDSIIDAVDASAILSYYAKLSTEDN